MLVPNSIDTWAAHPASAADSPLLCTDTPISACHALVSLALLRKERTAGHSAHASSMAVSAPGTIFPSSHTTTIMLRRDYASRVVQPSAGTMGVLTGNPAASRGVPHSSVWCVICFSNPGRSRTTLRQHCCTM